ncbi:hypothetical protein EVAR_14185_1 [Eumeta japonica]|uniref:Uncharacterized protein n=1 Tax=Eumeta variegata TaxID=151549 RepID=A0A4C1UFU9_EUMVA|nr:hypothetical protein EVAR_14185_1 [Eumeta japonica]
METLLLCTERGESIGRHLQGHQGNGKNQKDVSKPPRDEQRQPEGDDQPPVISGDLSRVYPPFTVVEIKNALKAIHRRTVPGIDEFTSDICRATIFRDLGLFLAMANKCLDPKSYRPIGLFLVLGETAEKCFDNAWWPVFKIQLLAYNCPVSLYGMVQLPPGLFDRVSALVDSIVNVITLALVSLTAEQPADQPTLGQKVSILSGRAVANLPNEARHSLLLPKRNPLVDLMIRHRHLKNADACVNTVLANTSAGPLDNNGVTHGAKVVSQRSTRPKAGASGDLGWALSLPSQKSGEAKLTTFLTKHGRFELFRSPRPTRPIWTRSIGQLSFPTPKWKSKNNTRKQPT